MMDKKVPDWEKIETEFRAGVRSLRDIAAEHGTTHTTIRTKADKEGWTRDKQGKIKARRLELLSRAVVSIPLSTEGKKADQEVIEANALTQTNVILAHRKDIRQVRKVAAGLVEELEAISANRVELETIGEELRNPDLSRDKKNEIYNSVIGFSGRVDAVKKLAETVKLLIPLEREAFGIESKQSLEGEEALQNLKVVFEAA